MAAQLRTIVAACLRSGFQMALYWGPELVCIYNDAERAILADLHPRALGLPARELLADSWDVLEPQLRAAMRGEATSVRDQPLRFNRHGRVELGYFTYSYSPLADDDGGIGGVLLVSEDTTGRVLAERRIDALRALASGSMHARTEREACTLAVRALRERPDVTFLLTYLLDDAGADLAAASRPVEPAGTRPGAGPAGAILHALLQRRTPHAIVPAQFFVAGQPGQAFVAPIADGPRDAVLGFLVAGIQDDLALDDAYRSFLGLLAMSVGRSAAAARRRAAERQRTQAMAALESARTTLFDNVSHELRTPLTLIIGSLEQLLEAQPGAPDTEGPLTVAHRSATRMLRLVNGLLDFSRIEAGEPIGAFAPVDLAELTRDVAAMFRSPAERAGLRLTVDCPPLDEPVYVDPEAWERILFNLLSNALKFTPHGAITVALPCSRDNAVLTVADTGTGIAQEHLETIFERFGRVAQPAARSVEGAGIGLALVRELAHLHGGSVQAHSRPGEGTCITFRSARGTCGPRAA